MDEDLRSLGWLGRRRTNLQRRLELVRMLRLASPWLVGAAIAAAFVSGVLPVTVVVAGGVLTDRIQSALAGGGSSAQLHAVYWAFGLVMGLFLANEVMVPVQHRLRWLVTKRVDGAARLRVMRASLAGNDMSHLHGQEYLQAMNRARGMVRWSATPGTGAAALIGVSRDYLTGIAAAAVLGIFEPAFAAIAVAAALFIRVRWRAANIRIVNVWIEGWDHGFGEAWYFTDLGLGRGASHEVRVFGLVDWMRGRIHDSGIRGWAPTWRERKVGIGQTTTVHLILSGAVGAFAIVWAARATARGDLTIGDLVVFVPALFLVLSLGRAFDDDVPVEYGTVTLPALQTLERLADRVVARESGRVIPSQDAPPLVQLDGVSFGYPGGRDVLSDVHLEIPAGGSVALVGMNGAGKTTLVRLVCGLYPPDEGLVRVNGIDLRDVDLEAWHRLIAPMFQEFVRLPSTVGENVEVGAVERLGDRDAAEVALAEAGLMGFAELLPEGLDSLLATRYADGTDLSGGQWQRLGIARALFALRCGARFLVLDEPTSNLDTFSEEYLIRRLLDDTRGTATTLLVTHRLALARRTDRIVVLEGGRIVEQGTHSELIELGGHYARAFDMQASLYPLEEDDG